MATETSALEASARNADSSSSPLRTRPLSPALGAEILDVDLSRPMDDRLKAQMLEAWHQNLVILLRDQHLTEQDQVRFAESFGAAAERARTPAELRAALKRAFARRDGPSLIEVPVGPFPTPWPCIPSSSHWACCAWRAPQAP